MSKPADERMTRYHWMLFAFLSVATFFEGYDFIALTQVLPELRADMGLSEWQGGALVAVVNIGTILSYFLVRGADRWGRRRILTITIVGYTICTGLTALAPNALVFAAVQLLARVFLIAEWAISMVIAAEEFPSKYRGIAIGVIQASSSLGSVVCAGVVPTLVDTSLGWRAVYLVGLAPLVLIAFLRRSLKETERFAEQGPNEQWFFAIWLTPYKWRVVQLALIWSLTYACTQTAIAFWKEFAVAERGFTDDMVAASISIAAVGSLPMVFLAGVVLDWLGRRLGGTLIFVLSGAGVVAAYTLHGQVPLTIGLVFAIFGVSAVLPVLNAYTTELFPTEHRAGAFAWSNNLLGRIGYVLSPLAVGVSAEWFGWGPSVASTAVFLALALVLIWVWMPETRGRALEATAALKE